MAHTIYDNIVLGNKFTDILTTKVDLSSYMTVDTSMTEEAGMKKKINTYKASGEVEDVAMGVGNTKDINVSFESKTYEVKVTQGRFQYYDEQEMTDPLVVEVGLDGLAKTMINDFTSKAIAEYNKGTQIVTYNHGGQIGFSTVVDAIAMLNREEDTEGLTLLISPAQVAEFRNNFVDYLKYTEGFVRSGYIGTVCGVPVVVSKAVPSKTAYLVHKEAVTLFIKKDTEIEQDRDANLRNNIIYARKAAVVALTYDTKLVVIKEAATA